MDGGLMKKWNKGWYGGWYKDLSEILKERNLTLKQGADICSLTLYALMQYVEDKYALHPVVERGLIAVFFPDWLEDIPDFYTTENPETGLCEDCDKPVTKETRIYPDGFREKEYLIDRGSTWITMNGIEHIKCPKCTSDMIRERHERKDK